MKNQLKTMIAALGVMLFCAAPAVANAERVYFLVGTRHVFRIGTYQYAHVDEREKIEQDYADQIASDQDIYKKAVADGADPAQESANLNAALDDLSNERDKELGSIYENADYERVRHPELQIQGDGPYQVMGINFHWHGDIEVFDDFYVYAPWPGYVVVGYPYGWRYGVPYTPYAFHHAYSVWYGGYVAIGRPAFVGIVGSAGPISFSIGIGGGGPAFVRQYGVRAPGFARSSYFHGTGSLHDRTMNHVIGNGGPSRVLPGGSSRYGKGSTGSHYGHTGTSNPSGLGGTSGSRYNHNFSNTPGGGGASSSSRYGHTGSGTSGGGGSFSGSRYSHTSTEVPGRTGTSSGSRFNHTNSGASGGGGSFSGSRYGHTSTEVPGRTGTSSGSRFSGGNTASKGSFGSSGGSRYSHSGSDRSSGSTKTSGSGGKSRGDNKDRGKGR